MCKMITSFFKTTLTWWNSQTIGTWLYTKRKGHYVGSDSFDNKYYQNSDKTRRWVIYNGYSEASSVPPDWHAWLHKITNETPTNAPLKEKQWEKPHYANATGSVDAYVPPSSLLNHGQPIRRKATGDYEAWKP